MINTIVLTTFTAFSVKP